MAIKVAKNKKEQQATDLAPAHQSWGGRPPAEIEAAYGPYTEEMLDLISRLTRQFREFVASHEGDLPYINKYSDLVSDFLRLNDFTKDFMLSQISLLSQSLREMKPNDSRGMLDIQKPEDIAPLPKEPPLLWHKHRIAEETPAEFIKRVYGIWLGRGHGLSRADIKDLDPRLYKKLSAWLNEGNQLPADVDLPTVTEKVDRLLARMKKSAESDDLMRLLCDPKTLNSVARAMERRMQAT